MTDPLPCGLQQSLSTLRAIDDIRAVQVRDMLVQAAGELPSLNALMDRTGVPVYSLLHRRGFNVTLRTLFSLARAMGCTCTIVFERIAEVHIEQQ